MKRILKESIAIAKRLRTPVSIKAFMMPRVGLGTKKKLTTYTTKQHLPQQFNRARCLIIDVSPLLVYGPNFLKSNFPHFRDGTAAQSRPVLPNIRIPIFGNTSFPHLNPNK